VVSEFDARSGAWLRFHGLDPAYCGVVGREGAGGGGGERGGDAARYQQALQLQGIAGITVSSSVRTVFFIYLLLFLFVCAGIAVSWSARAVVIGTGIATCFLNPTLEPRKSLFRV